MPTHPVYRLLPALGLAALGAALAMWLVPVEQHAVEEHLIGFPRADPDTHRLRPVVLAILCFLPALGAIAYALAGTLDRYLARRSLLAIGVCFLALVLIWLLLDLNDNLSDFNEADNTSSFMLRYYGVAFGPMFLQLAPFALLLGLLYCLGQLSASREIVAMIQSGRGVARVIAPLTCIGVFLSAACALFNYHLAPWGDGYRQAIVELATEGSASQARDVLYHNTDNRRIWFVGRFPYEYAKGSPLQQIQITSKNEAGQITSRFYADFASWNINTREWRFQGAWTCKMSPEDPSVLLPRWEKMESPLVIRNWKETPWQIVNPGLRASELGVPGLHSWLKQNEAASWVNRRPFLTQWHHRWAHPWICLVVVLLGAPLGIVFTRRGIAGGVAVAVFLSAMMLFTTEVFVALGDSGYLAPIAAAWGTNILFTCIALLLLWRRISGKPIYQSLKNFLPSGK